MIIIGLHGAAGAGKDTLALHMVERLNKRYAIKTECFAFADPIKEIAKIKFNLTDEQVHTQEGKLQVIEGLGITVRQALELEGTEATRDVFGDNFWIWHIGRRLEQAQESGVRVAVVTDVRFVNEAAWLKERGAVILHLQRDLEKHLATPTHRSAQPLPKEFLDLPVTNNGTLAELITTAESLADEIKESLN